MPESRDVPLEQVLADIREGLSDDQLMDKYGLSQSQLDLVMGQLISEGLITQSELDARMPLAGNAPGTGPVVPSEKPLELLLDPTSEAISPGSTPSNEFRPSDKTLRDYERKAFWGLLLSMVLGGVGAGLNQAGDVAKAVGILINLISFALYLWGFYCLVKRKGYHWAWSFFCFLSCIGLLIILFMKDKYDFPRTGYMKAIIAVIIILPIAIAVLGIILAISIPYYVSFKRTACDRVAQQELTRLQAAYDKYRNDPNNRTKEPPANPGLLVGPYYGWTGTDEKCQVVIKYDPLSHGAAAVAMKGTYPQDAASRYVYLRNLAEGSEQTSTIPDANLSGFSAYPLEGVGRTASCFDDDGKLREECGGKRPLDEAASLNTLAEKFRLQKKYAEAEPLYKRSLEIREKTLGPDHLDVAASLNSLALLYHLQRKYAEAEPLYKRSLEIKEKKLGPDHADLAALLNNLAEIYRFQRKYAEAEPLYKRCLAIREKAQGAEHVDVARSMSNLADIYRWQRKYAEAEPLYKRSLEIREKALGPDHLDVAASLNSLALLYHSQRKYAEAEPMYKRSLEIKEKKLGPDHADLAAPLSNLADVYRSEGNYVEAEPLYKRCLAIREKALGAEHPDVATPLSNLADIHRLQGRYAEAEPLYKRCLAIREKALGADHLDVGASLYNLAVLYNNQGKYAEAEPLSKRSLEIREKALGPDHPVVAISLNNLAELYKNQEKYSEAEPLFKRSLSISEAKLGPDDPRLVNVLNNLAALCRKIGKQEEASQFEERAKKIRSSSGSR